MPTIDVTDAAERLLANKTVTPGHCLMYVSRAIRNGLQPLIWAGLDTALNCWLQACGDKHTSRDVPKGFPAFLGATRYSQAGDVIISLGGGKFAATDWPGWGTVGVCTLEQREKQTGRKYLGYAGEFLGYTLTTAATASLNVTPITEQEEEHLMSQIQYYERTGTPQQEWMIAGEELPGGYEVTLDGNVARIWGRQYSGEGTAPVHVDRDTYIAAQAYWKARAAKWEARQVARIKAALGTPTAGTTTTVNAAPIDYAKLAVAVAKAVNDDAAKRLTA